MALRREALLAQAVLRGETRGYRNHPQLDRFKNLTAPLAAISVYLEGIHLQAVARGCTFDKSKIKPMRKPVAVTVSKWGGGQNGTYLKAICKSKKLT